MKYRDLLNVVKTGDLIFATGTSFFTKLICEHTGCNWSHAAVFVWSKDMGMGLQDDFLNIPLLWESTGHGVGEVPFDERYPPKVDFATRLSIPYAGKVGWRRIDAERTPGMFARLKAYCDAWRGVPYETDKMEMLKATWIGGIPGLANDESNLRSQFCWEAAVAAVQAMGLFSTDLPANWWSNRQLTGGELPIIGGTVGPLVEVEFP